MNRTFKNISIYILLVLLAIFAIKSSSTIPETAEAVNYSTFYQYIINGKVSKADIEIDDLIYNIEAELKDHTKITTTAPKESDLITTLYDHGVDVTIRIVDPPAWWVSLLSSLFPIFIMIIFMMFIMNQMQGGGSKVMQFGKSRAKMMDDSASKVTFSDVAGAEEAKEEMQEIVDFLKNPQKFQQMGAKIPRGVLLFGAPGTGKTLMAKAVAGEAAVPFFSISGSDFVEMFVGVGAARVRDLFEQAKKNTPCIVFIDEIDAVGLQFK